MKSSVAGLCISGFGFFWYLLIGLRRAGETTIFLDLVSFIHPYHFSYTTRVYPVFFIGIIPFIFSLIGLTRINLSQGRNVSVLIFALFFSMVKSQLPVHFIFVTCVILLSFIGFKQWVDSPKFSDFIVPLHFVALYVLSWFLVDKSTVSTVVVGAVFPVLLFLGVLLFFKLRWIVDLVSPKYTHHLTRLGIMALVFFTIIEGMYWWQF